MAEHKHTVDMVGPVEFRKGTVAYDPSVPADKPYKVGWMRARLTNGNDVFVGIAKEHPQGGPAIVHEFHAQQEDGSRTRLAFSLSPEACSALMALYLAHGLITRLPTIEDIKLTPAPKEEGLDENGTSPSSR